MWCHGLLSSEAPSQGLGWKPESSGGPIVCWKVPSLAPGKRTRGPDDDFLVQPESCRTPRLKKFGVKRNFKTELEPLYISPMDMKSKKGVAGFPY